MSDFILNFPLNRIGTDNSLIQGDPETLVTSGLFLPFATQSSQSSVSYVWSMVRPHQIYTVHLIQ